MSWWSPLQSGSKGVDNLKLGVVLLIFVLSVTVVSAADWDRSYKEGKAALENEDWPLAIQKFEEAIADNSGADDWKRIEGVNYTEYFPYFYLGIACIEQGDVDAAKGAFEQALRQNAYPPNPMIVLYPIKWRPVFTI